MQRTEHLPRAPGRIAHSPALDGLRGVLLLVLLLYHGALPWLQGGYLTVSAFFTLSGFLITSLLLVEQAASGRIDLIDFWRRRLRRLLPAALGGVALVTVYAACGATASQLARLRWDSVAALLNFANFRFMAANQSYWEIFSRPSPLQHYWSLSIEEQFYFAYPLLLIAILARAKRPRRTAAVVLGLLALGSMGIMIGLSLNEVAPSRLYYGTDTRASEFLVGAVLATMLVSGRELRARPAHGGVTLLAATYAVALMACVGQDSAPLYRGGLTLYAVAVAVLIHAALQPGVVSTALCARPLRWLGVVSYGAYVYHWPIYLWLSEERTRLAAVPLLALRIVVTLAVAVLSYRLLERPIRSGAWRGRRLLVAPAVTAAVLLAVIVFLSADATREVAERRGTMAAHEPMPALGPRAPIGPARVMILGDSIAWNIARGFARWAKQGARPVVVWNRSLYGCGLARGGERSTTMADLRAAPCDRWADWAAEDIDRFRPDLVVILSGIWDLGDRKLPNWPAPRAPGDAEFDQWLVSEYQLAVDIATSHGAHVVWLTSPCPGPVSALNPLRGTGALEPARIRHLNEVLLPRVVVSRRSQAELYDLFADVCPGGRYERYDAAQRELRVDELHISNKAAAQVAGRIVSQVFPKLGLPATTAAVAVPPS